MRYGDVDVAVIDSLIIMQGSCTGEILGGNSHKSLLRIS